MKKHQRADFGKIRNYPISERANKVSVKDFCGVEKYRDSGLVSDLFPKNLKADELQEIVKHLRNARSGGKGVIFALGAHVIKAGCSPIIIDWITNGLITGLALNGAGAIHDLEIALIGETSEDVETEVKTGRFGMVKETAEHTMAALREYPEAGFGQALGQWIIDQKMPHEHHSLLAAAAKKEIPATVHAAIGAEIIHAHPHSDGAIIGQKSFEDFKIFTASLKTLFGGGCYFNVGSAVILPEVFIKALSAARNLGDDVSGFMTVDFDMIRHYRPSVNVVHRPTRDGGKGFSITGHHEILLPLLYHLLEEG
ncbi:MAG: hypothetical protein IEMM0002_0451 [bacterium]|nr:MAG: hypothetical protein IEMM0002_0451 [bacterium]